MNLERLLGLFACQLSFYRIARNLPVPKNTPPKKDADTQARISILSGNLESHVLTLSENRSMLMKPKIGWGVPCACNGFMKRTLNSGFLAN